MQRTVCSLIAAAGLAAGLSSGALAEDWYPSKWGADDEIGAANALSPEKVLEAAKLITAGKTYRMGVIVGRDTPAFPPRSLSVTITMPNQFGGATFGENGMSYVDDIFTGWLGIGTQIDSLAHLGIDGTFYNGRKAKDFVATTGVKKMGIEKIPPIVTRGVLLDMAKYKGKDRLEEGEVITVDDLKGAIEAQSVTPGEGDVIVLHTGWLSMLEEDPERFGSGEPGINSQGAEYLAGLGVVAVGADTWGVEAVPFDENGAVWGGHQVLLAKNGVYILETLDTRELVADGVKEFMFTLGQPLYRGAVQAIVNPVAIR
ncbi:cyclase family protein [Kaustia mangrovi]|uniref:Cyclase family protein n=1 Tax=Kaustia mangrovi TaxID=2593653 RepID=A0A7S8C5E0_9HYPH|nr:cyclase family protein [Kaustia mangrovi]QPC43704.1 cyclase family protein [Kaustia mangrovi]